MATLRAYGYISVDWLDERWLVALQSHLAQRKAAVTFRDPGSQLQGLLMPRGVRNCAGQVIRVVGSLAQPLCGISVSLCRWWT